MTKIFWAMERMIIYYINLIVNLGNYGFHVKREQKTEQSLRLVGVVGLRLGERHPSFVIRHLKRPAVIENKLRLSVSNRF